MGGSGSLSFSLFDLLKDLLVGLRRVLVAEFPIDFTWLVLPSSSPIPSSWAFVRFDPSLAPFPAVLAVVGLSPSGKESVDTVGLVVGTWITGIGGTVCIGVLLAFLRKPPVEKGCLRGEVEGRDGATDTSREGGPSIGCSGSGESDITIGTWGVDSRADFRLGAFRSLLVDLDLVSEVSTEGPSWA